MIYHLLPELEAFSACRGGALARDIANIMRFDSCRVVVCHSADDTWGYPSERVLVIPELHRYSRMRGRRFYPAWVTGRILRHAFRPLLSRLQEGDTVWCHNQPLFAAALERAVHRKGSNFLYHCHGGSGGRATKTAFRSFTADAYIFVSDALRQKWLRLCPFLEHTYVVHNGADEARFYPLPKEASQENAVPTVLYIGQLRPIKGVHVLMAAMRILQERKVDVLCRVVGSSFSGGSKQTRYAKQLIKRSPSNVKFQGYRIQTEVAEEYRSADILCCPSIWQEPFGNVNIEAMACGIPVVASRVGGIPEIAAEGGVLLVEPDSPIALADALQKLIENKELYAEVATEGLSSFRRRFTWSAICAQYQMVTASLQPGSTANLELLTKDVR
jgi:spore coat protein SA